MTVTLNALFVKQFESNLRHLAQQSVTALRPYCIEKHPGADSVQFPLIGKQVLVAKSTRQKATPVYDTPFSNRVATPSTFQGSDVVEHEDDVQLLIDPKSGIAQALASACKRKIDSILIAAMNASAADSAAGSNALPAGQQLGGATTAFSFDLVTATQELFLSNDIDPDVEKIALISPNCVRKMMGWKECTSSDYVNAKALASDGIVRKWMGYTWISSNLLPLAQAETLQRYCFFFTRTAMGLQVNEDIWTRVAEDPSISFATRVYAQLSMGAVRIEDTHVIQVHVLES
jgi:hypothetical protein